MVNMLIYAFIAVHWIDVVDVLLVALLIYQLYYLIKGTAAINIFIGILLFYLLWILVKALNMQLFGSILGKFIDVGFIALLIVFQQELRRFLLFIGTSDIFTKGKIFDFKWNMNPTHKMDINAIVKACKNMSESKTGAIIIITKNNELKFYANTGDAIEAKVSVRMIESIFYKNSPLHDGALIISGNEIVAARCVLPVTENNEFPAHLGMRHRAAVGITENSDAIAVVVSEQTGDVSFSKEGELKHGITPERLREMLEKEFA
ncbi:MAG: Diadenylate cyclase [Bacteroidetes bacterium]|jgi:diadenylate cyclase|nr:Diadenylate cyclase [Bacteroidota bacterium]